MVLRWLGCDVYGSIMVCYICCSSDPLLNKRGDSACRFIYGHCILGGIGHCAKTFTFEGFDNILIIND